MPPPDPRTSDVFTGLILAGGRGRRMQGEDKGLIEFQGQALITYVLSALTPLTSDIIISANRNQSRYADFGYPVISDDEPDFAGPLAGILSGLRASETSLLICPCDAPLISTACLQRLLNSLNAKTNCAAAHDGERLQPMFLALSRQSQTTLETVFGAGERKLEKAIRQLDPVIVDCSDHPEWFYNANSPADLAALTRANPL